MKKKSKKVILTNKIKQMRVAPTTAQASKSYQDHLNKSIYDQMFSRKPTKAELTQLKIINAAILTYSKISFEYISYEDIARNGKLSRPLINHYFPEKKELFLLIIKYIRAQMQEIAVANIQNPSGAKAQLYNYVASTFQWLKETPIHMQVWIYFYYLCSFDNVMKEEHQKLTLIGAQRIAAMLELGILAKEFKVPADIEILDLAKTIQSIITGSLIEVISERGLEKISQVEKRCCYMILKLVT